jgi:hypothetical protein
MVVKVGKSDIILILSLHPHNVPGRLVFVAIYWCFLCPFSLCGTLLWRDNLLGFGLSHHEDNLLKFELNHLIPTTKYKHDTSFQSFCIAFLVICFFSSYRHFITENSMSYILHSDDFRIFYY